MRWFQPTAPAPDLRNVLTCGWNAISAGRHQLIPDGCMDLLWIDGRGVWLCGPDTHGWAFELPTGTVMSGVRFRPGAAAAVLRLDARGTRDVRLELADVIGSRRSRILDERVAEASDSGQRLALLEDLTRGAAADTRGDGTAELAALVGADPAYGVERLATQTGVSSRQLRRRFDRGVGYGPAFLARIARLQRFARAAGRGPDRAVAELAAAAGYADQSHLAKDCRSLALMTPCELVDELPRTSVAIDVPTSPRVRSVQDGGDGSWARSAA